MKMNDKSRLEHIKLVVIIPKKHGQVKNLYDEDFKWLIKQAEKVDRIEKAWRHGSLDDLDEVLNEVFDSGY